MSDMSWMTDFVADWDSKPQEERDRLLNESLRQKINEDFGWAAAFIDHPEVGPVLQNAARGGWTMQKLETEVRKTKWFQQTTQAQRQWDVLEGQDPATAERQVTQRLQEITRLASQLGAKIDADRAKGLARQSLRNGWQGQDLSNALGAELVKTGRIGNLRRGLIGQGIQSSAREYGVPLSQPTVNAWVQKIADGRATQDDYMTYVRNQARSMFPTLSDDLDRGLTVQDVADPYREVAARVLQINPSEVDFSASQWNRALNFAGQDGKRRVMTLDEWENVLRQDDQYGYMNTEEATEKAYQLARGIGRAFGRTT